MTIISATQYAREIVVEVRVKVPFVLLWAAVIVVVRHIQVIVTVALFQQENPVTFTGQETTVCPAIVIFTGKATTQDHVTISLFKYIAAT